MNAIRFGLYAGIIWAVASVLLIEISVMQGAATAWVELDFRFLSGITLIILPALGMEGAVSEVIQYAQYGMPIVAANVASAIAAGFIDGFVSGFFIAIFYNFLSIISEGKNFPASIKFGIAMGVVLAITSALLALVSVQYGFEIDSFGFAIRPLFLTFLGISSVTQITDGTLLSAVANSYLLFPNNTGGAIMWAIWGFIDGFIGGVILSSIVLWIKRRQKPHPLDLMQ